MQAEGPPSAAPAAIRNRRGTCAVNVRDHLPEAQMDILEKLREEHDQVKQLLEQMVEDDDPTRRKTLFKEFRTALVKHAGAEEKAVYDRLIRAGGEEPEMLGTEGYIEHGVADDLIARLGRARNKGDVKWSAGIKVLKEIIEHHIEEEESDIFKTARRNFKAPERERMDEEFEKLKAKVRV